MRIFNHDQRSPEWFAIRGTLPTASRFKEIMTTKGEPSKQQDRYANELVANWLMGEAGYTEGNELNSPWVDRGVELEDEARLFYSLKTDRDVENVGFCLHDSGKFGCSPDGLVTTGGLEIKCPAHFTHVDYLLRGKLPSAYFCQVQGSMLVTDCDWWDFLSYHPSMEPLLLRVFRDEKFLDKLIVALFEFNEKLDAKKLTLQENGYDERRRGHGLSGCEDQAVGQA